MTTFKNRKTLDDKHEEMIRQFEIDETETIPKLLRKKNTLQNKVEKLKKKEGLLGLNQQINQIDNEIIAIQKKKKDYWLNNSKYIFNYFETKKEQSTGAKTKTKNLDSYFNISESDDEIINNIDSTDINNYFRNTENSLLNVDDFILKENVCLSCNKGEMIPSVSEGILVCNNCFVQVRSIIDHDKQSYKEPPQEVCFYAYKRINHFREILAQFQAKETTLIPDEVLESIKLQIRKERISLEQLTNKKAKEILKKLGYNKYYEHIPFIKHKLGIKPPVMTQQLEDTLCNLFMEIQRPYAKYCPKNRVNFLNYYYTVYKLCELLKQTQFLPYFPMLKDREKRIEQDEIWKKICKELNWPFIATI